MTLLYSPSGKPTTAPVNVSKTIQKLAVGSWHLIGLHGGEGAISVGTNDPSFAVTTEDAALNGRGVRWFRVTGKRTGNVMFEARDSGGVVDYFQIAFVAATTKPAAFVIPKDESRSGAQFTSTGHFWRLELSKNSRAIVGFEGNTSLRIESNNPNVADTGQEILQESLRKLPIVGVREGDAMIEARDSAGRVQAYFQVHVGPELKEYGLLCEGHQAGTRVAEILQSTRTQPEPGPYHGKFGVMALKRGMVWDGNRMIVHWDHQYVLYLVGSQLWKVKTPDFYNDIFYKAFGTAGQNAKPFVAASQVLMSAVTGFLVGPAIIVASYIVVLTMCIGAHWAEAKKATDALTRASAALMEVRRRYPTLWTKLKGLVAQHIWAIFPEALIATAKDPNNIAFYLGRLLRGTGAAEALEQTGEKFATLSMKVFVKVCVKTAAIVQALHLGPSLAHVTVDHIKQAIKEYSAPDTGMRLSEQEARAILEELKRYGDSAAQMEKLQKDLNDVLAFADLMERELRTNKR